jgi:hypothetical protein
MKKIFTLLFIGFFIFSCEFDEGFEEMNVNPAKANQIEVGNKLTWTMLQTSGGRFENSTTQKKPTQSKKGKKKQTLRNPELRL